MHREDQVKTESKERKKIIHKPRSEVSEETNPTNILILDFYPPEQWTNKFLLFMSPSLWYFFMAALANQHTPVPQTWHLAKTSLA